MTNIVYQSLKFPILPTRPYFFTDFVSTVDGKVKVLKENFWPIGSRTDHETFTFLRAHADAIIDGKNSALAFGKNTIETINSSQFKHIRKQLGKTEDIKYFVLSRNKDQQLEKALGNPYGFKPDIFSGTIEELVQELNSEHISTVFIDGGPTLLANFLERDLLDEIFLTIAPRIFGGVQEEFLTMVEGILLSPEKVRLELTSVQSLENEVYLRYKVKRNKSSTF